MATYQFWQIDAFSRELYQGNAAAVVFDADPLSAREMQVIARQMNLSETVFLCTPTDPTADYRARIFTPRSELPFAGHPTLATAHAWYHARDLASAPPPELRQECGIGIVHVAVTGTPAEPSFTIAMAAPHARALPIDPPALARMLGCPEQALAPWPFESCSVGLPWMVVALSDLAALTDLRPDQQLIERCCREHAVVGLSAYALAAARPGRDLHVRSFAPGEGVPEDPVCGSGNGAVALHVARHPRATEEEFAYTAEQGLEMGYDGEVQVTVRRDDQGEPSIRIGGAAVTVMRGELYV